MSSIKILNVQEVPGKKAIFFNVLIEIEDLTAVIIPGWKVYDGRLYPPSKPKGRDFFSTILVSPQLSEKVQVALEATLTPGIELEKDAWSSAKWGQASLKSVSFNEEMAMDIWRKYKGEK